MTETEKDITKQVIISVLLMIALAIAAAWYTVRMMEPRSVPKNEIRLDDQVKVKLTRKALNYLSRHHGENIEGPELKTSLRELATLMGPYFNIGDSLELIEDNKIMVVK